MLKKIIIVFLVLLFIISFLEIFDIYPYAVDVKEIYKSEFFKNIEKSMFIISDNFLRVKTYSEPEIAWLFLNDIYKKYKIKVHVYNHQGYEVDLTGKKNLETDSHLMELLKISNKNPVFLIKDDNYIGYIPMKWKNECNFCHKKNSHNIVGVLKIIYPFDSKVYYQKERKIIFSVLSFFILCILIIIVKLDINLIK